MEKIVISLPNETATITFGATLAISCKQTCVIYLYGDLGSGKTTFCRGFIHALGYKENVQSPTFTLVESYILPQRTIYHFDLYRITNPKELIFIGIQDYFNETAICLVEWPQHGIGILPIGDIALTLKYQGVGRWVQVQSLSANGQYIISQIEPQRKGISS